MRLAYISKAVLLGSLLIAANTGFGQTAGAIKTIEIPERSAETVAAMDGDYLYTLGDKEGLVRVDLGTGETTAVAPFALGRERRPILSVSAGRALVGKGITSFRRAGGWELQVVELTKGKVLHTLKGDGYVRDVGFIEHNGIRDRAYVVTGGSVHVFDLTTGKMLHRIAAGEGILSGSHHDLKDNRLYVARGYSGGLLVVDLTVGKLLDEIKVTNWLKDVRYLGGSAFVTGDWGVGIIDLKSRTYKSLPEFSHEERSSFDLINGNDGEFWLFNKDNGCVVRYHWSGKKVGEFQAPAGAQRMLDLWNGHAVFLGKDTVRLVKVS